MKINEIILVENIVKEAEVHPDIRKILVSKGYKFLDSGQDQDVFLAPDRTILKIFGYESNSKGFSKSQQSFIDFVSFCNQNKNNEFLPQFFGWETFTYENEKYLQIKCERLFPLSGEWDNHGYILERLASLVKNHGPEKAIERLTSEPYDFNSDSDTYNELFILLGEDGLQLLANTINQLNLVALQKDYTLDLHSGNFMFGSDGHVVINDPFFTGSYRQNKY